jgi:tetratricopeptide (TPR) repeat protein
VASALSNLASLLNRRGEPTAAEPLLRESLEIGREMLGDHPEVADATMNLATTLADLGRLAEAESLLHEALAINRARRGPQHPRTGLTLYHLATIEQARGGCAAALPLYRQALDVQEGSLPEGHDETEGTRAALTRCQAGR